MRSEREIRDELDQLRRVRDSEGHRVVHLRLGKRATLTCAIERQIEALRWVLKEAAA